MTPFHQEDDNARTRRLASCWAALLEADGGPADPVFAATCDAVDTTPHLVAEQRARLWQAIAATPDPIRPMRADGPRLVVLSPSPNGRHPVATRPPAPLRPRWSAAAQALASLLLVAVLAGGGLALLRAARPLMPNRSVAIVPARAATPGPGVEIAPIVSTTTDTLPLEASAEVGVMRLPLGPRATIAMTGPGVNLTLVEAGALTLTADQPVLVARAAAAVAGQPRALRPERNPRLGPGDWYADPDGVDAVAANPSDSASTVLLVLGVDDLYASSMQTTGQVDGTLLNAFTQPPLPANPARLTIARATFAPGATLSAPAAGTFQFAAPAEADAPILKVSTDGSAKNVGDRPVTAYLITVEPLTGPAATPAAIRAAGSATIVPEISTTTDTLPTPMYSTLWIYQWTLGPRTAMTEGIVRAGPALVRVEQGTSAVTASVPLPVARAAAAVAGRPLAPTLERNPVLTAGDWVVVPAGVDARWSNPSADAAVLLSGTTDEPRGWPPPSGVLPRTVAAGPVGPPSAASVAQAAPDASAAVAASQPELHRLDPPSRLTTTRPGSIDVLQLGSLTQPPLPPAPATVAMSLVRLPAGSTLPPPPPGEVRLFAADPRDGAWLRAGVDGSARNVGDHEITVHLLSVAPAH